ncbi:MAG: heme-binding protein [Methylobacteriaceae bacterium]|nr:heme-binding protein [Methylobacteriaceae bacterium]
MRALFFAVAVTIIMPLALHAEGLPTVHRLPAALALEAVGAAVATCARDGYRVSAMVLDIDAVEIASLRGDGSGVHTLGTARGKALAAVSLAEPILNLQTTGKLAELFPQQSGFQAPAGMLFRAGGIVIKTGEEVIGAIGVGGSREAEKCAQAGLDKIKDRLR